MLRKLVTAACALTFVLPVVAADPALETEQDKMLYALGLAVSRQLQSFELTGAEIDVLQTGIRDGLLGAEPKVPLAEFGPKIDPWLRERMAGIAARRKEEGQAFVAKMAQEPGATQTDSGLVYFEQQAGDGESPSGTAKVSVHYEGMFPDGKVFDSSKEKGVPAEFALNAVVPCFSEGIRRMKVGGRSKLVCPSEIAYGEGGFAPMIPPGATLVFEVELLGIVSEPTAAPAETSEQPPSP
jgi:FKBP-type peptidyl-prolyl cis-trans isomerase